MSGRHLPRLLALVAVVALAAVAAVVWRHSKGGSDPAGPLACRGCATISVGLPVKTGQLVVAGDMGHHNSRVGWPRAPHPTCA